MDAKIPHLPFKTLRQYLYIYVQTSTEIISGEKKSKYVPIHFKDQI